jgi:hypothetical protein
MQNSYVWLWAYGHDKNYPCHIESEAPTRVEAAMYVQDYLRELSDDPDYYRSMRLVYRRKVM